MQILPGILESSFGAIQERVEEVSHSVQKVHVDICDGMFVPSKTWPYSGMITGRIEENFQIKQLMAEDMGLPLWDSVEYQFDLMIKDPWRNMALWAQIGATSVIIHPTSCESSDKVIVAIELAQSFLLDVYLAYTYDEWKEANSTPEKVTETYDLFTKNGVKGIQCMTIQKIGVQGQKFDERWEDEMIHQNLFFRSANLKVQIDGGIHEGIGEHHIDSIFEMDADSVVIGSGIFAEGNPTENISFYKKLFS
jgi:pentose-5-phosphate-3-epimerase